MVQATHIKIGDIESELRKIKQESKEQGKTRACLFNLIVYTKDQEREKQFSEILRAIVQKFPCRILFIKQKTKRDKDSLITSVLSESYQEGKTSFTCDLVTFEVQGRPIERIPYLVLPHLVPDLPIYLLLGHDPTLEDDLLAQFEKYASRLIFDTGCTRNLQLFSTKMLKKIEELQYDIRDIQWGLTGPFRDIFLQTINTKERFEQLQQSSEVIITHNTLPTDYFHESEIQSIYLQAWLSKKLEWTVRDVVNSNGETILNYDHGNAQKKVILQEKKDSHHTGGIQEVKISSSNEWDYQIVKHPSSPKACVKITTANTCLIPITLPLPDPRRGFTFMKEIFYETTSKHYQDMLEQLSATNWKRTNCKEK